jgi:hypothetical protein
MNPAKTSPEIKTLPHKIISTNLKKVVDDTIEV